MSLRIVSAFVFLFTGSLAWGQANFPSMPVRLVVGYPPGGSVDLVARMLAQELATKLPENVIVDTRPGANGNLSASYVARAKPDGHTILFNTASVIYSRAFSEKLDYDLFADLAPISLVATTPYAVFTHPSVPANTLAQFKAYLSANPGKVAYGTGGTGSGNHLAALLYLQANGLDATHVPYKGSNPAMLDVVAGRVQFSMQTLVAGVPMMKDKRIKALAVTGLNRSPILPDVPTVAESGMPGFEVGTWFGIMAPVNVSPAVIKRLNAEILKALRESDMKGRLAKEAIDTLGTSPEEYGAYLKKELSRWSSVVKSANLKLE